MNLLQNSKAQNVYDFAAYILRTLDCSYLKPSSAPLPFQRQSRLAVEQNFPRNASLNVSCPEVGVTDLKMNYISELEISFVYCQKVKKRGRRRNVYYLIEIHL